MIHQPAPHGLAEPTWLHANDGYSLHSYRQLVTTVLKWKTMILGVGLLLATTVGGLIWLQPPVSWATAKILLKPERTPFQVPGLGSSTNRAASLDVMQTEIEFLSSSLVLMPVAKALIEAARASTDAPADQDVPADELEHIVNGLRDRISVAPIPSTSIIQVTYAAGTRREAEETLRLILKHYIEEHTITFSGAAGLSIFYHHDSQKAAEDLDQAEEQLREWQEANKILTAEGEINARLTVLAGIDASTKRVEVDIEGTRAHIAALAQQIAVKSEWVAPNRLRDDLARELAAAEVRLSSLRSQRDALRTQFRQSETVLADLRAKRIAFDRLSRGVEHAKAAYFAKKQRLNDARVIAGLEDKYLSRVSVLEWPRTKGWESTRRQIAMVVMAGVVGVGVGIAIAFAVELFKGALRTADEVEFHLGLPVLAAVPELAGLQHPPALALDVDHPSRGARPDTPLVRVDT